MRLDVTGRPVELRAIDLDTFFHPRTVAVVGASGTPGRPNTAMQSWAKQLSDTEIAAVITYARNSFGNKANEVQPAEVNSRRKK